MPVRTAKLQPRISRAASFTPNNKGLDIVYRARLPFGDVDANGRRPLVSAEFTAPAGDAPEYGELTITFGSCTDNLDGLLPFLAPRMHHVAIDGASFSLAELRAFSALLTGMVDRLERREAKG